MNTTEALPTAKLQDQVADLQVELYRRDEKIVHLDHKIQYLEEQLAWFKRQIFGKRSERVVNDLNSQQLYFEGFENLQTSTEEEKKLIPTHERKKPDRDGKDKITLPPDLPVQTRILDIPEEEKVCTKTGVSLVQIGVEVSHKLAHQPGSYYIKEIIRPKYAHPQKEEAGVITASLPDSLLPKCRADESLLAEIITKKFALTFLSHCRNFEERRNWNQPKASFSMGDTLCNSA